MLVVRVRLAARATLTRRVFQAWSLEYRANIGIGFVAFTVLIFKYDSKQPGQPLINKSEDGVVYARINSVEAFRPSNAG